MTAESQLLIDALAVAVTGQTRILSADVQWPAFLKLSDCHGLTALACDGLQKTEGIWEQIPENCRQYLEVLI